MTDDRPIGHIFYGVGQDPDGSWRVLIRIEMADQPEAVLVAQARFSERTEALRYMRLPEDDITLLADLLGLDHRRSNGNSH